MPHLDPLPWEASPQFRERFQHYQDTRGFVPNEAGAQHFDEGQIVEIVATIALFGCLNRWNDTMATTLDTRAVELTDRAIGAVG